MNKLLNLKKRIKIVSIHPTSNLYLQRERFEGKEVQIKRIVHEYENGDVKARVVIRYNNKKFRITISRVRLENI